VLMPIRGP